MGERPESAAARSTFWDGVHGENDADGVSWWQSAPNMSLQLITAAALPVDAPIIDVGAGCSTLVDHLVEQGYRDVTAVDVSSAAMETVRERLGDANHGVTLEVADVLDMDRGRRYDLWHDRAVFHFLVSEDERDAYRRSVAASLRPGGWLVVATFGPEGPTACSGLPTVRYAHRDLAAEFPGFNLIAEASDDHTTPWGTNQQFIAVLLRDASGTT